MKARKPYTTKLKHNIVECLKQMIEMLLEADWVDDEDKLFISVLSEINDRLYQKLGKFQAEYHCSFTPSQAFALRLLYLGYVKGHDSTYMGNRLQQISMEVHKQYF